MINNDDFIKFRKELHSHPELSGQESDTKQRVKDFVSQFNPNQTLEIGQNGILFVFKGKTPGKSILVRAELDALPIQEVNTFPHRSKVDHVSHKCGHDGHMAILARLAYRLSQQTPEKGICYLLYQPAEETGEGAKEIINTSVFNSLNIDCAIALHNIPGYPLHSVIVRNGIFTPAVSSMIVKFIGKTSHAAEPENGINPAEAITDFIKKALTLIQSDEDKPGFFLVTPVHINMGEKSYGISAGYGEVHLTIRAQQNALLAKKSFELESSANRLANKYKLEVEIERTQEFKANVNDRNVNDAIRHAAKDLRLECIERNTPMKWGEDFGLFTESFPGAMFGLGSGVYQPALHNSDYDFPDELIETGSNLFYSVVTDFLND